MFCAWRLIKIHCRCCFKYCSNISPFLWGVSSWDVDVNWNGHVWFGGLIVGRRLRAMSVGLIGSRHGWSRWCWRRYLRRLGWAEAFLPDQHADQEEDQRDTDHGGGRGESPMGLRWLDLIEFFEQLASSNSPLYLVQIPWMALWMLSVLALPNSSANSPVQSMVFLWISMVCDSSAEITWSMVRMLMVSPELIWRVWIEFLAWHTWFVLLVPVE